MGVTLHRDAPHRHGALFTHAVLAVADPLLSGLEQSRRGSPRAPGRCPGLSSCSAQQQARSALGPPLWPLLWSSCCDTPVTRPGTPPPNQPQHRCQGRAGHSHRRALAPSFRLSEVGPGGGTTTHEFGKPVWSHAGWKKRRKGDTGGPGVCGPVAEAPGHRDTPPQSWPRPQPRPLSSHREQEPGFCSRGGPRAAGRTGWSWPGTVGGRTPRQDRPRTEETAWRLPAPSSPPPAQGPRSWVVLTALGHTDVGVGVEEEVAVGTEAALHQPLVLWELCPAR